MSCCNTVKCHSVRMSTCVSSIFIFQPCSDPDVMRRWCKYFSHLVKVFLFFPHRPTHSQDDWDIWQWSRRPSCFHIVFQSNKNKFSLHIYLCAFKARHQQAGRNRDKEKTRMKGRDTKIAEAWFLLDRVESIPLGS